MFSETDIEALTPHAADFGKLAQVLQVLEQYYRRKQAPARVTAKLAVMVDQAQQVEQELKNWMR